MTTSIGAPFIPPDNVLLSINGSTGALQLKPGTQGDILYAGASGVWTKLGTGTNGQLLTAGGAAANPSWTTVPQGEWILDQTLSPSGVSTISTSGLTAYKAYKIVVAVLNDTTTSAAMQLRINGDSGANYKYKSLQTTTVTDSTGVTAITFCDDHTNTRNVIEMVCAGTGGNNGTGGIGVSIRGVMGSIAVNTNLYLAGQWLGPGPNEQVTSFTILSSQNFSGKILVYGRNDL